jgi:hypothetical protein
VAVWTRERRKVVVATRRRRREVVMTAQRGRDVIVVARRSEGRKMFYSFRKHKPFSTILV